MEIRRKPESCLGCQCYDHGTDFSAIEGTGANGVMMVGEASGEHEARAGLPFRPNAPAGSLLERVLRRMSLDRQSFATTNVVRCRPRNNWLDKSPWEYSAINHCRPNLDAAISEFKPKCLLALGGIALRQLTGYAGEKMGISHLAGYVLPGPLLNGIRIPTIGDFHPAFLRRGKASYQGVFSRIITRAIHVADGSDTAYLLNVVPSNPETHGQLKYITRPSLDQARSYRTRVLCNSGIVVSYDIETRESHSLDEDAREGYTDTHIQLIQFSTESGEGIAFPYEGEYRTLAGEILGSPNLKCGHNVWLFDNPVLRACGERDGIDLRPRGTIHDTLQMFHHWQPDLPAHLQFAAQFVQFPFPWKHFMGEDMPFYGICDTDATLRLYILLEKSLRRDGIWD